MKRTDTSGWPCTIARSADILGDHWNLLIIRQACLGTRRFDDFQAALGIGRNILTQRLARLVDEGVLARVAYQQNPPRFEYRLTDKGLELNLALTGLRQWGDKYLSKRPPRVLRRKSDGKPVIAALVLEGARVLRPDEVESVAGPLH